MGGSAETPALTALLCLGLCWGLWAKTEAGTLPKPIIWADPGPMVAMGSPVTIWCQGSPQVDTYHLFKAGVTAGDTWAPWDSRGKASFPLGSADSHTSGPYSCAYHISGSWSRQSDPLYLVVTGIYGPPSLSAHPSPVVALGEKVSLLCSIRDTSGTAYLLKEGGVGTPQHMVPKFSQGRWLSLFSLDPVNHTHGGTYRCYGSSSLNGFLWTHPSNPLELQVTGVARAPSLTAQPSSLVLSGDNVTLQCHSGSSFDRFSLIKDSELTVPQHLDGQHSPVFPLGPVRNSHGGRYRCYGGHSLSSTWSAPSAPLDILVAGVYQKPSLWAHPGTSVAWGESVTLQCLSEISLDTFHLSKEGSGAPPQHCPVQDRTGPSQANFTLSAVTMVHGGTYRCYGSHSTNPYLLSQPSEPLELVVAGDPEEQPFTPMDPGPQSGLGRHLQVLVGVSVAFILLLFLLFLLLLCHRCQSRRRKAEAAEAELKDRDQKKSSSVVAELQEKNPYAAVKDTQSEDRQQDRQAAASEAPKDVTYAELCSSSLQQTSATSHQRSGLAPDETSVYAALAVH